MKDWNEYAQEQEELLRQTLRELAAIPAPSGHEERRKAYCESWLDRYGISHESGNGGNLLIPYRIQEERRNRVVTAHMDIVFEESVPLRLQEDGAIWRCPGIGDNTANVVLLLLAAKYLYEEQPETEGGLWLIADTCEEGLGNLAGCRSAMEQLKGRVDRVLGFDLYRDRLYTGCIGSVRYRITAKTPGGHSFADFGVPNAIHVLAGLIDRLYEYRTEENTTYNVGLIAGGTSVNTIAQDAQMLFEYRSDEAAQIRTCKAYLEQCLRQAGAGNLVSISCEAVGERPCAEQVDEDAIRELAAICSEEIASAVGTAPAEAKASTDCNIPLSMGIPAVCAGFFRGGGAHTREEWLDLSTAKAAIAAAVGCVVRLGQMKPIAKAEKSRWAGGTKKAEMENQMEIRKARLEDQDQIMEIYSQAKAFMDQTGNPTQWKKGYPPRDMVRNDIESGNCYVGVTGSGKEEIHAVFVFLIWDDPTYRVIEQGQWKNDDPYGVIHRVASDGTQKRVVHQIVTFCRQQIPNLRGDTHQDNLVMQRAMEREGFERCGIIHVEDGTPRIAYQLTD